MKTDTKETGDRQATDDSGWKRTRYLYLCRDCASALTGLATPAPPSSIPRRCADCRKADAVFAFLESGLRSEAARRERLAAEMFYRGDHGAKTIRTQYTVARLLRMLADKTR